MELQRILAFQIMQYIAPVKVNHTDVLKLV